MLFLLTALFCEAKPYIESYQLKRVSAPGHIQLFEGDGRRLAVSGAGPISASAAAYMLTRYAAGHTDIFVNIGVAGSSVFHIGEIATCHKIVNTFTGRAFYPEMLYKHPFLEGILYSVGRVTADSGYDLTDMEGAFVYESARIFLPVSQIHCIKVISDGLRLGSVTTEGLTALMYETAGEIGGWMDSLPQTDRPSAAFTDEENLLLDLVSGNLSLSYAMRQKLRQACGQAKIRELNIVSILSEYSDMKTQKTEGKPFFVKLVDKLREGS